jgi:hypothetical protein
MKTTTKKLSLALSLFLLMLLSGIKAQNVYFSGVGRALVTNDVLTDDTETASKLKASGGYTLFDLGIYAKPNEVLRGGVILRTRNEFGGFFGQGARLEFRQLQLEGLIAKKVKYDIGDIYLSHTPYTLWNEEIMYNKFEAGIFSLRRDIVNYENFFVGNTWRMQGFNTKSRIGFSKGIESIDVRVYGGRTVPTDFLTIPDRYFYGGRFDLTQGKYLRIAGNLAGINDIPGTVKEASVNYRNIVYTTDLDLTLDKSEKFKIILSGEAGASGFNLKRDIDSINNQFRDFFYDAGVKAIYKPLNLSLGIAYRNVGFNFNSPMAQTRRIGQPADIALGTFPLMNDGLTSRPFTLFDPLAQENNLYNQSISPTLMNYYIQYDMTEPYGKATPNRKGITLSSDIKDSNDLINAGVEVNLLTEVASEGDSLTMQKRKFTLIRSGFRFNVNKLMGYEKVIAVNAGLRTESSSRTGTNPVSLASTLIDLGFDVEFLKSLHLLGGFKMFAVKGSEVQTGRNELNQIILFSPGTNFNQRHHVIATGLRYDYDKNCYFSMHYHMLAFDDNETSNNNFNLNQWFFVFGLKF